MPSSFVDKGDYVTILAKSVSYSAGAVPSPLLFIPVWNEDLMTGGAKRPTAKLIIIKMPEVKDK